MRCAEAGDGGEEQRADTPHGKRRQANPRGPVKRIDVQARWDERAEEFCRDRPVEKQQLVPGGRACLHSSSGLHLDAVSPIHLTKFILLPAVPPGGVDAAPTT